MKTSFDIGSVLKRIGEAVRPLPKAAMFEPAEQGLGSRFEQLMVLNECR